MHETTAVCVSVSMRLRSTISGSSGAGKLHGPPFDFTHASLFS